MTAPPEEDDDHAYFQAIEEVFLLLRGAPLVVSPADWQVARRWHREGIPLRLVWRILEEVFAKRKERKAKGRISSLRYAAPAVEAAWARQRELAAPGERSEGLPLDLPARLGALAAALPESLPGRAGLAGRIAALDGDSWSVEERLAALDQGMLEEAERGLDPGLRAEVEAVVEKTLASLSGRLTADERERSRERLRRQVVRQRLALPVLSLFSPEAEPG